MKLKDILAISGKPGLYKFISQGRNGIIVESFADKKRMVVHSTTKVSALEDIAIYTEEEEVPLKDVFSKLYEKEDGEMTIDHKSGNVELKNLFNEITAKRAKTVDIKEIREKSVAEADLSGMLKSLFAVVENYRLNMALINLK